MTHDEIVAEKSLALAELMGYEVISSGQGYFVINADAPAPLEPYSDEINGKAQAMSILLEFPKTLCVRFDTISQESLMNQVLRDNHLWKEEWND